MAHLKTALLLSGGMDSSAIAFWKRPSFAMTLDYGQKPAAAEIRAAGAICTALSIEHHIISADLRMLGSGDMAGIDRLDVAPVSEWWPFRNQMLITLAAMKGIGLGIKKLQIGTLNTDESHADGRADFVDAMDRVLRIQEGAISVEAPAIKMNAIELIQTSGIPMEILAWAHSCHVAEFACGMCRGCRKHYETMAGLGIDPY